MGYTPNEWHPLDVITSEKLNELEKGLTKTSENVVYGSGGATQSSDGIHSLIYIKKGEALPNHPQVGDTIFMKDGNDFSILEWDGEQWSTRIDPKLSERIQTTLDKAKADTTDLIIKNNDEIKSTIDEVSKEKIDLALKDADFNKNAQAMANKALADAKANTAQAAQEALNSANKHLADAKKDLTDGIAKEASARNEAVAHVNSQAQSYVNQAKNEINDTINALSVGGRNYILDTANPKTQTSNGNDNQDLYDKANFYKSLDQWAKTDTQYKISFDWNLKTVLTNDMILTLIINQAPWQNFTVTIPANKLSGHVDITFILWNSMISAKPTGLNFRINSQMSSGNTITYSNLFMKSGTITTDWTPAPEDVVLDYTTKDNKIKETISQYQETTNGNVSKVQTDVATALGQVATKVSQTDYDKKTGDLSTKYTQVKQTVDSQAADIVDIKKTATSQASKINSISSDVDGTKQSISDIEKTQHGQSDKINQITSDVNGTKQSITDIQTKDEKQDTRMGTIETSVSGVKNEFSSYKTTNDGVVKTAQTTAQTAVDGLKNKVSQTDYDKKTGQLQTDLTSTTQTANQAKTDIASIKQKDGEQDEKMNTIVSDANGTKQTVSDLKTAQDKQSGYISTLQQRADGFDATVTKVDNLSVGGRNLLLNTATPWTVQANDNNFNFNSIYDHLKGGTTYTFSAEISVSNGQDSVSVGAFDAPIGTTWGFSYNFSKGVKRGSFTFTTPDHIDNDGHFLIYAGTQAHTAGLSATYTHMKLEEGNVPTAWTPAQEDVQFDIAQVKVTADGVSSIVSNPTTGLSTRVQTAEGTLNTVKSTADGAMSKASQTANDIKKEIQDRTTGDSNTLQSAKDFTQSSITSYDKGIQSQFTQTSDAILAKVGATNLFPNSEFEKDYGYRYTDGNTSLSLGTKDSVDGRYNGSVHVTSTNNSYQGYWTRNIPVYGGQKYSMSVLVHYLNGGLSNGQASLDIWFVDKDWNRISQGDGDNNARRTGQADNPYWVKLYAEGITAPINAAYVQVSLLVNEAGAGQTATFTQPMVTATEKLQVYTPNDDISAQLSLLKDNWSIGITDNIGKITSGIVGSASQMSLISKKVVIDSPSTQITGTAWINSAMIQKGSIVNANIADAAITSAKIAQLDVAKLTGDTTSFIKSNWSSAYGNVSITPTNITLQSRTGTTLMTELSIGNMGISIKMPGVPSFLDSTLINASGMSFQHNGGSYATVGVTDAGFTLEHNNLGGAPMSIKIGDGVHNIANDMVFAITAAQDSGTSPQLLWAGNGVGKISSKYRTWDNPAGFIIADNIKFSTWDNTASRVEIDDTVNFYNYAPVQVYGQRFTDGTTRSLHLSGKGISTGSKWFGFLGEGDQAGFGTDNTGDVWFFMGGKPYSLYRILDKLGMR